MAATTSRCRESWPSVSEIFWWVLRKYWRTVCSLVASEPSDQSPDAPVLGGAAGCGAGTGGLPGGVPASIRPEPSTVMSSPVVVSTLAFLGAEEGLSE